MPIVDVIIPAYNAARYLPAAIESVMAQSFDDWQIVLVDDGSTDDTVSVIAAYRERLGTKLRYIYQPNAGLPAARNTAIRNSSSEFLALLDADDIWLLDRLKESLAGFADRPEVGLNYASIVRIDPEGKVLDAYDAVQPNGEGRIAPHIYTRSVQLPCPTITFRRACVEDVGYFDETMRASEDRDMWFRIALKWEVAVVPKVLAQYRTSPTSMTTDPDRMLKAQLQFIEKHRNAPGCGVRERRIALSQCYRQRAEALAMKGDARGALGSAMRAVGYYPAEMKNLRTAGSLLVRYLSGRG